MRFYRVRKFPSGLGFLIIVFVILSVFPTLRHSTIKFTIEMLSIPVRLTSVLKQNIERSGTLRDENVELKQQVATLTVMLSRKREITLENERLRSLLDFKKSLPYQTVVAQVIGRDSSDWRSAIIINKGAKHGVFERMACATSEGLVGSIYEVGPSWSRVMLITDPSSRVGIIVEPTRESGVLVGFSGSCKAIYLSLDAEIKTGERVLTAGFSDYIPKGISVGRIRGAHVNETNLYKYSIVDPLVNMNGIEEIICINMGNE